MIKVLMIEDDLEIADLLTRYLEKYNITLKNYPSPMLGLNALEREKYQLIILDLTLPNMDGMEVCKIIRAKYKTPIIISSARKDITDKVLGLESGADDYLPKPYDPRELVARIHSVLRRLTSVIQKDYGEFSIHEEQMKICREGEKLNLTRAEYEIFKLLLESDSRIVTRETIVDQIDVIQFENSENTISVIISRLRQKIGDSSKQPKYIESVRGVGYRYIGEVHD